VGRGRLHPAFALVLVTAGRLGDILGRKHLFLGVTGFTAASVLCAAAQSPAMLIGSRGLQGAMAAKMIPRSCPASRPAS
jgi:MFS family permease